MERRGRWPGFYAAQPWGGGKAGALSTPGLLEAWYLPAHRFLQQVLGTQFPFLPSIFIFIYLVWSWLQHLVTAVCKLLVMVMWGLAPQLGIKLWPLHWEQSLNTRPPGKSLLLFNASHFCSFISFQNGHALIHNLPTCCLLTYRAAHSVPGPPLNPGAQAI